MTAPALAAAEPIESGTGLRITWSDGQVDRFHALWLRDNALDAGTRDPKSGQKLVTIGDIPDDTRIGAARLSPAGEIEVTFEPGGKTVAFPAAWLAAHACDRPVEAERDRAQAAIVHWDRTLAQAIPSVTFEAARHDPSSLAGWLGAVRSLGFAVMNGLPNRRGALLEVVALFGYVRETNYGRWFEVRSEVSPVNLAYTGLGLQVHTDNPYRDPVPTLQLLACLANSAEGGDSIVVDGFHAAGILRAEDAAAFELLARHSVPFVYAGSSGVRLESRKPMIEVSPEGRVVCIRFNNRSAAPFALPYEAMGKFYAAYRRFAEILERPELRVRFKMAPGDLFIVDNTRVLHGRTGFSGAGSRHLQGCYADKDGLLSTLAVLERQSLEAAE